MRAAAGGLRYFIRLWRQMGKLRASLAVAVSSHLRPKLRLLIGRRAAGKVKCQHGGACWRTPACRGYGRVALQRRVQHVLLKGAGF